MGVLATMAGLREAHDLSTSCSGPPPRSLRSVAWLLAGAWVLAVFVTASATFLEGQYGLILSPLFAVTAALGLAAAKAAGSRRRMMQAHAAKAAVIAMLTSQRLCQSAQAKTTAKIPENMATTTDSVS